MGDIYHDEESHVSKSTDSSVGSDASVVAASGSGSGVNCTLESPDVSGQSCTLTSSGFLEENSICDSAGFFHEVQTMQSDVSLYRDDIVQCTEHEGLIGMVTKVAGDSDSDGTSSDSEDQDEDESIPEDCAHIVWTNLSETTEKISDIEVLDRGFLHGDIVAAASDPSGQTGIVVNVDLTVDLLTPTSTTVKKCFHWKSSLNKVICTQLILIALFQSARISIVLTFQGNISKAVLQQFFDGLKGACSKSKVVEGCGLSRRYMKI